MFIDDTLLYHKTAKNDRFVTIKWRVLEGI